MCYEIISRIFGLCHSIFMDPCSCTILKALTTYTSQRNLRSISELHCYTATPLSSSTVIVPEVQQSSINSFLFILTSKFINVSMQHQVTLFMSLMRIYTGQRKTKWPLHFLIDLRANVRFLRTVITTLWDIL